MKIKEVVKNNKNKMKETRQELGDNRKTDEELFRIMEVLLELERDDKKDKHSTRKWSRNFRDNFLALPQLPGDRTVTKKVLTRLLIDISKCRLPLLWNVVYCKETKQWYRSNGTRSANASLVRPDLFEGATVYYTQHYAETLEEATLLLTQFDKKSVSRTVSEALNPYIVALGIPIPRKKMNPFLVGIRFAEQGRIPDLTMSDKIRIMTENAQFLYWAKDNLPIGKTNPTFFRKPMIAFIFILYSLLNEEDLPYFVLFLQEVMKPSLEGTPNGMGACLTLNRKFLEVPAPQGRNTWLSIEQFMWAVNAWNAAWQRKPVSKFSLREGADVASIRGTKDEDRWRFKILEAKVPSEEVRKEAERKEKKEREK